MSDSSQTKSSESKNNEKSQLNRDNYIKLKLAIGRAMEKKNSFASDREVREYLDIPQDVTMIGKVIDKKAKSNDLEERLLSALRKFDII